MQHEAWGVSMPAEALCKVSWISRTQTCYRSALKRRARKPERPIFMASNSPESGFYYQHASALSFSAPT